MINNDNKYAFICSPYAGDVERNKAYAIKCCKEATKKGYIPIAPHLYFPQFLYDSIPDQRELGLTLGREAMKEKCSIVFVGDEFGISEGMKGDLDFADQTGISIEYLTTSSKFSKSEIIMAIRLILGFINTQGHILDVFEYSEELSDVLRFNLLNKNRDILYECDTLYEIFLFLKDNNNTKNRTLAEILSLMNFVNYNFVADILQHITASVYSDYVATGFGANKNLIDEEIKI